jgi:hypothetical protein
MAASACCASSRVSCVEAVSTRLLASTGDGGSVPQSLQCGAARDAEQPAGKSRRFAQVVQLPQRDLEHVVGEVVRVGRLQVAEQHAMHRARKTQIQLPHRVGVSVAGTQHQHCDGFAFAHPGVPGLFTA